MHVIEFLQALFFTVHIEGVESPLPDTVTRLIMHGGRQAEAHQHLLAPAMLPRLAERSEYPQRRLLLQLLQDSAGSGLTRR